jgi:hypothetical protein
MVAWAEGDEITVAAATAAVNKDGIRIKNSPYALCHESNILAIKGIIEANI